MASKTILFFLFLFFSIIGYTSCSEVNNNKKQTTLNSIVIILDSNKINYDTIFWENGAQMITQGSPVFSFFPCDYQEKLNPVWNITQDTLSLLLNSEWCIVKYRYNPMSAHSFLLYKDDTVFINHKNGIPFISVSSNKMKANDINYDYFKRLKTQSIDNYSLQDLYDQGSYLRFYSIINHLSYETIRKELKDDLIRELKNEKIWLDSLKINDLVSEPAFDYYISRNHYNLSTIAFENLTKKEMKEILINYNDSSYIKDVFGFYSSYYLHVANSYYANKEIKYANNTMEYDYKDMYDTLDSNPIISGRLKDMLKWHWLHAIIRQQPINIAKAYYEKTLQALSDTNLTSSLIDSYANFFDDSVMQSVNLELMTQGGDIMSFETILNQNKGKVIYIDFWASWCAPCLHEMPYSIQLSKEYKDIVFIYIAINDKKDNWLSALQKAGHSSNSYLILNPQSSSLIKDLQISSIPRYLIYDKEGRLVYANAPSPSSNEIANILEMMLAK